MDSASVENIRRITAPLRRSCRVLVLIICWAVSSPGLLQAASYPSNCVDSAGTKDPTFYRPPEPHTFVGASLSTVELATGQIMVALFGTYVGGLPDPVERSLLVRLNSDGTPDLSFNFGDGDFNAVHVFAVSSNGLLAVATWGFGTEGFFNGHFHVSRSDGIRIFSTQTSADHSTLVRAIAWDAEGRVVIGGNYTPFHEGMAGGLARLNGDGTLDATFVPATNFSFVIGLAVQADGKLLVLDAGKLHRLMPDGSFDINFLPVHFDDWFADRDPHPPAALVLQPDGKILVAGPFSVVNGASCHSVVRLNSNGSRDMDFDAGSGAVGGWRPGIQLALQSNGKILLAGGFTSFNGVARSGVVRLRHNGTVDATFNTEGQFDDARSVTVLGSGRLLVTDYLGFFGGSMSPHRLLGDPAIQMFQPTMLGPNQVALEFSSVPGVPYVLQQSTNLTNWQRLATNTAGDCRHRFTNGLSGPPAFFRVLRQD